MLQITTFDIASEKEASMLEKNNHEGAFEYLPEAKMKSYDSLLNNGPGISCTIQLVPSEKEDATENTLIAGGNYLHLLSASRRAFLQEETCELLSLSYNLQLTENNEKRALIVHAVLKGSTEELPEGMLDRVADFICKTLSIEQPAKEAQKTENQSTENEALETAAKTVTKEQVMPKMPEAPEVSEEGSEEGSETEKDAANDETNERDDTSISAEISKENPLNVEEMSPINVRFNMPQKKTIMASIGNIDDIFGINEQLIPEPEPNIFDIEDSDETENEQTNEKNTKSADKLEEMQETGQDISDINEENVLVENETTLTETKNNIADSDIHPKDKENENEKQSIVEPKETIDKNKLSQKELYENSSKTAPFLNLVDEYIPESNLENIELFREYKDVDADIKTVASQAKIDKLFAQALNYCYANKQMELSHAQRGKTDPESFLKTINVYVEKNLDLPPEDRKLFMDKIARALFSYYILIPLIDDPKVSDIKILAPDKINVKIDGIHYTVTGLQFINDDDYELFVAGLMRRNQARQVGGIALFTDTLFCKDYILRFNITLPQLNVSQYPVVHIRKTEKEKMMVEDLIEAGMMDKNVATYIQDKIRTSRGVVFAGPSASGKSKALNAFAETIPFTDSVLAIQEADEIFSKNHPNMMCQHIYRHVDGTIITGMDKLGENGLVCDIKYFIIGEIKGAEARDFLRACNTGHICLCTVHTPSAEETIPRFADYVKLGANYTMEEAERLLKDLEIIVYINGFKVQEITEVLGYDDEKHRLIYRTVYLRDFKA